MNFFQKMVSKIIAMKQFQEVKFMKNNENNNQKQSQNEYKKYEKYGKAISTPPASLVTSYEYIPLRINTELMTAKKCDRLRLITGRDNRIIKDYLRIIYHNEDRLAGYSFQRRFREYRFTNMIY